MARGETGPFPAEWALPEPQSQDARGDGTLSS
jgi:hypothetical protein